LERQKSRQAIVLSAARTDLRRLRSRAPEMRSVIEPELARLRELSRRLRKVKSGEEMRQWRALFEMCLPGFRAPLRVAEQLGKIGRPAKAHGRRGRARRGRLRQVRR
jgi:hypothetical protein